MKRRDFIKHLVLTSPIVCGSCFFAHKFHSASHDSGLEEIATKPTNLAVTEGAKSTEFKSANFDSVFSDDIFWPNNERERLLRLLIKTRSVQRFVGNGNFNLIGMDEFFRYSNRAPGNAITKEEMELLEKIFYYDSTSLGFHGDKVCRSFTASIKSHEVVKIPHTGHYLRKGKSLETYNKIVKDVGSSLVLTSGVRGLAKQFHLFLEKASTADWNFSLASRSLAPPGYSFHGKNDFDIGKLGNGLANFTDAFSETVEFKKLIDLGYVDIRYKQRNQLGVRFEPWHIKI